MDMDLAAILMCVDCKNEMKLQNGIWRCAGCGRVYEKLNSVIKAYPADMEAFEKSEAEYHDGMKEDPLEIHQLTAWRNLFYHTRVVDFVRTRVVSGLLLELGAGSGFDAAALKSSSYDMILTDISALTLERASKLGSDGIAYIAAEGRKMPFRSGVFDGAYMIATLHHFKNPDEVIDEMRRVLKPGGYLIVGVEPNEFYFKYVSKFRRTLCRLTHTPENEGSVADAEMTGFGYSQWRKFFSSGKWEDVQIRPMWLFAGWIHYLLEFLHRAFKSSQRLIVPKWIEKLVVQGDELLFRFPFFQYLCWHWIASAKKSSQ